MPPLRSPQFRPSDTRLPSSSPADPDAGEGAALLKLAAGDFSGALSLLDEVIATRPDRALAHLSRSYCLAGLGRSGEALAAAERALAVEPRSVSALLQAAELNEQLGRRRTAAAIYRTALGLTPAGAAPPPPLARAIGRAKGVIEANNAELGQFLAERLEPTRRRHAGESLLRVDHAMQTLLLRRRVYRPQPSFLFVPHLPIYEFYDRDLFPWLKTIEAATPAITDELMSVMAADRASLRPYMAVVGADGGIWRELNNSRRWSAFFFWREGERHGANLARCPNTAAALREWPSCDLPGCAPTAMFSILEPRTRIPPHTGTTNARLVVHVPLVIPPRCGFRVGAETRDWRPGEALIFDDTIEHEAWNDSDDWRAVLILDVWNPFLSEGEREMVRELTAAVAAYYGELPAYVAPIRL